MSHRNVAALARTHAHKAIEVMVDCMNNSPDDKVRLDAASRILDRGIGKPIAPTIDLTNRFSEITDDQLEALIGDIKNRIADLEDSGRRVDLKALPKPSKDVSSVQ